MQPNKPNILVVVTDQQRADTVAALGHPLIKTPAMDRLCREGTAFTRCYTPSPVCVPARHAMASGLPPHISGVTDNGDPAQPTPSFMQRLQASGYQTHGVGKMHFTPDPLANWGFDGRDTSEEGAWQPDQDDYVAFLHANGYGHLDDYLGVRGEMYYVPQPSQVPERLHHTRWVADRGIDFMNSRERDRPFLLCTHFVRPHPPFESPVPWNKLYRAHEIDDPFRPENAEEVLSYWNHVQNRYKWRDGGYDRQFIRIMKAAYFAAISYIDQQLGRLLEALGDELDNTLIIYTSDHGELLGDYNSFGKRCMLDASARVPMLVRWPGHIPAGQQCDEPTTLLDVFPTVCKAGGAERPTAHESACDLVDVANDRSRRGVVFSQFQRDGLGLLMCASKTHKYIYSEPDQKEWGFDLMVEGQQEQPVAVDDPAIVLLKNSLIDQLKKDGYTAPLDESATRWRSYPHRSVPDEPDEGLLLQDRPGVQDRIDALGPYARTATQPDSISHRLLNPRSSE